MKFKLILFLIVFSLTIGYAKQDNKNINLLGKTLDGKEIKLSDYKNKIILLDFWASWCIPCREEMPELIKFYNKHKKEDFVIIGINIDDHSENMRKFIDKLLPKPTFPIIWDSEKKNPANYKIDAMPTTIFIDKKGKERFRHNGFKLDYIKKFESEFNLLSKEN